jgi:tRNA-specific 2-thiouridylase
MSESKPKAVVMLSGGLDSTLALAITKNLGFEPIALSLKTPFCNFDCGGGACAGDVSDVARRQNIKWVARELGDEYIEMVRNPKHGRGTGMNPCIDCRVMMFKEGKKLMEEVGAQFLVTGEVLGQRPMSQNMKAMEIIEKESGLEGKILRPLSAKLLKPTEAESKGMVDRNRLLAISGRSRREQIRLAKELGISRYPNSGGGCILTEKAYAARLRDLFEHTSKVTKRDTDLLKIGRHFRLSPNCKLIVGRNMVENNEIEILSDDDEVLMTTRDYVGPTCLLQGDPLQKKVIAAGICVRYSDAPKERDAVVRLYTKRGNWTEEITCKGLSEEDINHFRI